MCIRDRGLITYMRKDSLRISAEARAAGNAFITETYGEKYLPKKPRYFKDVYKRQKHCYVNDPGLVEDVEVGTSILINDGLIAMEVTELRRDEIVIILTC